MMRALLFLLLVLPQFAHSGSTTFPDGAGHPPPPCSAGTISVDCRGSQRSDPTSDGARFVFSASGGTDYYAVLTNRGVEYPVVNQATGGTIFRADAAGNYRWDIPIAGPNGQFANECLPMGNWSVRIYDARDQNSDGVPDLDASGEIGCFVDCSFTLFPPCPPPFTTVFTVDASDVSCAGTDGFVRFFDFQTDKLYCVENDGTGAGFSWTGPNGSIPGDNEIRNLTPGFYAATVTDAYDCGFEWRLQINQAPEVFLLCEGLSPNENEPGNIRLTLAGGTPPYSLRYDGTAEDGSSLSPVNQPSVDDGYVIDNLVAGTYNITITDAQGCETTCSTSLCRLDPVCSPRDPVTVAGTGSVDLTLDGTADWQVNLSGSETRTVTATVADFTVSDLAPGDYSVVITDALGCTGRCEFSIAPLSCTLQADPIGVDPTCFGSDDGTISLNVQGAIGAITTVWDPATFNGSEDLTDLGPGDYSATVTDAAGCSVGPLLVTLEEPLEMIVNLSVTASPACPGEETGALLAVTGNVREPAQYTWSKPGLPDQPTAEGLGAGDYSVTVTDAFGCRATASISIAAPPEVTISCTATDESVMGATDGTVRIVNVASGSTVRLSGDLGDVVLSSNGDTTFTDLPEGNYQFTLTDENGCTDRCSAIVNGGTCQLSISLAAEQPDCDDRLGNATVTPTMGTEPYQILWSTGETNTTISNLPGGRYTATVTDVAGCAVRESIEIIPFEFEPSLIPLPVPPSCSGECVEISLILAQIGPYTLNYRYTDRASNSIDRQISVARSDTLSFCPADFGLTEFDGGEIFYNLITDGVGCSVDLNLTVPLPVFPPALGSVFPTICPGDTFLLRDEPFFAGKTSGDVVLPNSSANGCDSIVSVSLDFFPAAVGSFTDTICQGDTLNYRGRALHLGRTSTTVVLRGASALGCDSTVTANVAFFEVSTGSVAETLCPGDTLSYGGQQFFAGADAGAVVLPGATMDGCDSTVMVTVDFYPAAVGTEERTVCITDTVTYAGIDFHAGNPTAMVVLEGASQNGCDSTVDFSLDFYPQILGLLDTVICEGTFFDKAGVRFDRETTEQRVILPGAGAFGCDSLLDVSVTVEPIYTVTLSGDGGFCPFQPVDFVLEYDGPDSARVTLNTNGADTITLLPGTNMISRVVGPEVTVAIAYTEGPGTCAPAPLGSVLIEENEIAVTIDVTSGSDSLAIECNGIASGSATALATGGEEPYTYLWSNGAEGPTVTDLAAGSYRVTATSNRGCEAFDRVTLSAPDPIAPEIEARQAGCDRELPALVVNNLNGGLPPYTFSTGNAFRMLQGDSLEVNFGETTLTIQDANGCEVSQTFLLDTFIKREIDVTPKRTVIQFGEELRLDIETSFDPAVYRLGPEPIQEGTDPFFTVSPAITTSYGITATDPQGCAVTDSVQVIVDRFVAVYAPNIFSPNGDDTNDKFRLYPNPSVQSFTNFAIYNRWGEQVYRDDGPISPENDDWGWDGNSDTGRPLEQGAHAYTITITLEDGRSVNVAGNLVLVR